jgi:hypothetical protein
MILKETLNSLFVKKTLLSVDAFPAPFQAVLGWWLDGPTIRERLASSSAETFENPAHARLKRADEDSFKS